MFAILETMIEQLRIYRIEPSLRKEFDDRFRLHASRIMQTYGFNIKAMWYSEQGDKLEFVYILTWADEATMKRQWQLFMADKEWSSIKDRSREQYGEMVLGKSHDQVLDRVSWFKSSV